MVTFQAKIGWNWSRKRKNKNYRFVSFLPNAQQKIPNKQLQRNSKNQRNTNFTSFEAKIG